MSAFVFLVQSTEFSDTRTECSTHTRADYYRYKDILTRTYKNFIREKSRAVQIQEHSLKETKTQYYRFNNTLLQIKEQSITDIRIENYG